MPQGPSLPSLVWWPFSVLEGTISWVSGGFLLGSAWEATRLVAWWDSLPMELGAKFSRPDIRTYDYNNLPQMFIYFLLEINNFVKTS